MPNLGAALRLATEFGYLPLRPGTRWLRDSPDWLISLQTQNGVGQLESRLNIAVPECLREFWAAPDLVRLLDSWRWQDYLAEEPRLIPWGSRKFVLVCSIPHSGGVGAVPVGEGEDPPLCWGWEDDATPTEAGVDAFSDFVYLSIKEGPSHI